MLKDADNELLGAVRTTGLFLGHQGRAGTVQQVDLVVYFSRNTLYFIFFMLKLGIFITRLDKVAAFQV